MPAGLIKFQVKLKRSRFVGAWSSDGSTSVADARIGEWSAGFARQPIQNEVGRSAIRLEARMQALFVVDHLGYFSSRSGLGNRHRDGRNKFLAEIQTSFDVVCSTASDNVTRQTAVIDRIERRV